MRIESGIKKRVTLLLSSLLLFSACGGLDFSKTYPGAEGFHPHTIVVLPVTVGTYETAQELVEDILVKSLGATGWYSQVVAPHVLKARLSEFPENSKEVSSYIVLLNTLGVSDRLKSRKIGGMYQAQALFLANMTDWGYGWIDGEKMGWLGLSLTLVDVRSGDVVWEARHKVMLDYYQVQPTLSELCTELLEQMLLEMPH